ncbi:putative quinol monooxygenase [Novosphingobium sp.]|uniref:putative quinol monooxygenase n=1 Tax=Novosphingobium sp. TaxID=1874826 RepID=UPI0038B9F0F7
MIIVMGSFRLPPEQVEAARPLAEKVVTATRAEDGCIEYAYAQDLFDPGLFRISEKWRDRAALDAHFRTDHMKVWAAERAELLTLSDRNIRIFETDEGIAV